MEFISRAQAKKQTGLSYIGTVNSSPKLKKNLKVYNTDTYGVYLAPYNLSGYNVCKDSTPECRKGCLFSSGQCRMDYDNVAGARIAKTRLFHEDRNFFMKWMITEIDAAKKLAAKKGHEFSVRLNCTSDIDWANVYFEGKNVFQHFPDVIFYDYTKNYKKFHNIAPNYHLTFSYTGRNKEQCLDLLKKGFNIAVVFNTAELPAKLWGFDVADGDKSDLRTKDGIGSIIGLKFKQIKDRQAEIEVRNSVFCIQESELELCLS